MCSVSVTQFKIAQGGPILYVSFWPQTGRVSSIMICFGASNLTLFAIGCSSLKRTDSELPVCEIFYGF